MKTQFLKLLAVAVIVVGCGKPILNGARSGLSAETCQGELMVCDAFHRSSSNETTITMITSSVAGQVEYHVDSDNAGGFLPDRDVITCTAEAACTSNTGAVTVTVDSGIRRIEWQESLPIAQTTILSAYAKKGTQIGAPITFRREQ